MVYQIPEWLEEFKMNPDEYTTGHVQPGWLCGGNGDGTWINWPAHGNKSQIVIDGIFSASQLRDLANHMEAKHD